MANVSRPKMKQRGKGARRQVVGEERHIPELVGVNEGKGGAVVAALVIRATVG